MKKIDLLKKFIFGDTERISPEKYFIITTTIVASIFLLILCIFHIFNALSFEPVVLAGSSSLLMLVLYYFIRFKNYLFIPKIILTVGGLIMLDFTWYAKFLSNGPVLLFILIFAALVIWVWEGKSLVFLMMFYFFNLLVLFYIDYNSSNLLLEYPNHETRSIDIFSSLFFYSILLIFLLYVIKQEFLRQREKAINSDKLKSAFLANMSHEIRTPMNGILGFSSLLKDPNLSGNKQQQYIEIIEKSGHRMLNIINDIIDISKIESGLMTMDIAESDINEQLEYIYTFFRPEVEAKGMKIFLKDTLPSKEAIIKTDSEKIFAVLTNLVKNAIKYSNKGNIEIGYVKKDDVLEFFIKDTGIGIPKERQESIFERFIQADIEDKMARQGAGLGLAITKAYVEGLGGRIWVESQEENLSIGMVSGSTFYFTIPYTPSHKKEFSTKNEDDTSLQLLKQNIEILIVEDDESSAMLLELMVENINKKIIKAKTGFEAIEAYHNNPNVDLIMMDIQLPGMNGLEVTRQVRKFNTEVIIIAQTAYGLSGDKEKAIGAGCNDYVSKPIKQDELFVLLQKYFKK